MVGPLLRGRSPTRSVAPKQPRGSGVLLSGISALARGCRRIWRGVILVYWFRRRRCCSTAIGPAGRCRGGVVMIYWFRWTRVNPSCHPYARARARPWSARCYGVARQRDRSRQNSRGAPACFSPAFRRSARGCRRIWRGKILVYWFRRRRCRSTADRAGWAAPARGSLIDRSRRTRVNPSCHPYTRARARPWSARCYGVARQRDRSRQNSRGARACFSPAFRASRVGAKNLARRNIGLLVSAARRCSTGIGPAGGARRRSSRRSTCRDPR